MLNRVFDYTLLRTANGLLSASVWIDRIARRSCGWAWCVC
jgi:hypothetical protein